MITHRMWPFFISKVFPDFRLYHFANSSIVVLLFVALLQVTWPIFYSISFVVFMFVNTNLFNNSKMFTYLE